MLLASIRGFGKPDGNHTETETKLEDKYYMFHGDSNCDMDIRSTQCVLDGWEGTIPDGQVMSRNQSLRRIPSTSLGWDPKEVTPDN